MRTYTNSYTKRERVPLSLSVLSVPFTEAQDISAPPRVTKSGLCSISLPSQPKTHPITDTM